MSQGMKRDFRQSADAVAQWVEQHGYQAYDPGDGDLSFVRHLTFGQHTLRRILTAVVLRTPFHIRPLLGIRPHRSTKGMGYMGWGHAKMFALTGEPRYRQAAEFCFGWLLANPSPLGEGHYCWGNHFAFSTRGGTIPRYTPTVVWSSLIGLALVEAYETLGHVKYLEAAASTAEWVKQLPREQTSRGVCLSYVPIAQVSIHNSNLLGAALLARVAQHTGDEGARQLAREAVVYGCERQNEDGAWYYGEHPKYHWIDNFHTGYNLDCLKRYASSTGDHSFDARIQLGYDYFKRHFFEPDGTPKYYHNQVQPIDIQCASQAIDTLAFFSPEDPEALVLAQKVARWTIDHMQAADGHFYYRDLGWKKIKIPMFHWGQGTMFKALAHLLNQIQKLDASAPGARTAAIVR